MTEDPAGFPHPQYGGMAPWTYPQPPATNVYWLPQHYAHLREGTVGPEDTNTAVDSYFALAINPPELVPILLDAIQESTSQKPRKESLLQQLRWTLLKRLRCPPPAPSYTGTEGQI